MCEVWARGALSIDDGANWTINEKKEIAMIEQGEERSKCIASGALPLASRYLVLALALLSYSSF